MLDADIWTPEEANIARAGLDVPFLQGHKLRPDHIDDI